MKRRKPARDQEKELADQTRLLRSWRQWHREQLSDALAGVHGTVVSELMMLLDRLELNSAAMLLDFMQRTDWREIGYGTKLTVLHQVSDAITKLRERHGLTPFDDGVMGDRDNVFRRIRHALLCAAPPGAHPGLDQTKQGNDE